MENLICKVDEELWLDYVEGELDQTLRADLTLHVEDCGHCRKTLQALQLVRKNIKPHKIQLPDDLAFKRLENKIMAEINKTYIESPAYSWKSQTQKMAFTAAAVFIVVFGTLFVNPFRGNKLQTSQFQIELGAEEQFFAQTAANDPKFFNSVIMSHQDSDDMVMEAAAQRLSAMSDVEARALLEELN